MTVIERLKIASCQSLVFGAPLPKAAEISRWLVCLNNPYHPLTMSKSAPKHPYKPVAHALLRTYKATLSIVFYAFGARCRHLPTCSEFGAEAASRHGWWAGGWMTLGRIWRCRRGGTHGHDPVPLEKPAGSLFTPWKFARWRGMPISPDDDINS